jgi:uncharacterized protein YndB with AHSA1/START domain
MAIQATSKKTGKREFKISRIFDQPREKVWTAWTEPEHVRGWWGPRGFTAPFIMIDFTVGGDYLYDMRSQDGKDFWNTGTFKEIVPMERISLTDSFSDDKGNIVPATYYGMSEFPLESMLTVTFEDDQGKTKLTLTYGDVSEVSEADLKNMAQGWNDTLDKLVEYMATMNKAKIIMLPGKQEMFITRVFNAPRDMVYRAFTEPELYEHWLGPRRLKMTLEKFEPRAGGSWRYIHEDENGNKFGFHGVYHEMSPELMIDTFEFEGLPEKGHVSLETLKLEEMPGGKTRMTEQSVFQTVADRDGMAQSGMEEGINESYERLDELLESMKSGREERKPMLNLNSILIGTEQPDVMKQFYERLLGKAPEMIEGKWFGW